MASSSAGHAGECPSNILAIYCCHHLHKTFYYSINEYSLNISNTNQSTKLKQREEEKTTEFNEIVNDNSLLYQNQIAGISVLFQRCKYVV